VLLAPDRPPLEFLETGIHTRCVLSNRLRGAVDIVAAVLLALAPGAAAAHAAQGQGASPNLAAALASPCSMITLDEAQTILGDPGMQPARATLGIVPTCEYSDNGFTHQVDVSIYTAATARSLATPSAPVFSALGSEAYCDPRTVQGGDQANLYAAIDANDALQVIEQQGFLTCAVVGQFAQTALGRLATGLSTSPSETPPPVQGGALDNAMAYPCSIVTTDEAMAIFGVAMQTTQSMGADNPSCQWHGTGMIVSASIYTDTIAAAKASLTTAQPVTGLGAEAYCSSGSGPASLTVDIDGSHYLGIFGVQGQVTCAQEQQFARTALPRL
jgi:hypothetical protein